MIKKCNQEDGEKLYDYIGSCYPSCLYLYMNIIRYGICSSVIDVFFQEDEKRITSIFLKYYSCLHVFSKDNYFCADEIIDYFNHNQLTMIYCTAKTAERIYKSFALPFNSSISLKKGWVAQIKRIDNKPRGLAVKAEEKDFDEIIRLIYNDEDIGRSYRFEELTKQLIERNKQGYSRNLVIKQNDIVIAHICTNAELDNIAVVAELLVKEEYRRKGFASEMMRAICGDLLSEGKEVYSFYYSDESRLLHKHIGFFEICEWAKIVVSG